MAYTLPELPYDFNALEPHIDEQTLWVHHGKHHSGYVNKLNRAMEGHEQLATSAIADLMAVVSGLPNSIRTAVQRNGGQHYNHSLYWQCMRPAEGGASEPAGALADAMVQAFGDFARFKELFAETATKCFGSGWAWMYLDTNGKLAVCASSNEINPLMTGITDCPGQPLLVVDVWEHAYYLKYQNRRPEYLEAWWNLVDWEQIGQRYDKVT